MLVSLISRSFSYPYLSSLVLSLLTALDFRRFDSDGLLSGFIRELFDGPTGRRIKAP